LAAHLLFSSVFESSLVVFLSVECVFLARFSCHVTVSTLPSETETETETDQTDWAKMSYTQIMAELHEFEDEVRRFGEKAEYFRRFQLEYCMDAINSYLLIFQETRILDNYHNSNAPVTHTDDKKWLKIYLHLGRLEKRTRQSQTHLSPRRRGLSSTTVCASVFLYMCPFLYS